MTDVWRPNYNITKKEIYIYIYKRESETTAVRLRDETVKTIYIRDEPKEGEERRGVSENYGKRHVEGSRQVTKACQTVKVVQFQGLKYILLVEKKDGREFTSELTIFY